MNIRQILIKNAYIDDYKRKLTQNAKRIKRHKVKHEKKNEKKTKLYINIKENHQCIILICKIINKSK